MIAVFRNEFSGKAAAAALLLGLSIAAAQAQTTAQGGTPAEVPQVPSQTRGIQILSPAPESAAPATPQANAQINAKPDVKPDTKPETLATDAIRVPAMGTAAEAHAEKVEKAEPAKPKKRVRVVRRVRHDDVVYVPRYYAPRPFYRFGYGYGPGIRLYRY